eukprot:TRINITY_DN658_c0_g1_i4.p1 TRINITY_DN658_c0_g1~~TRINITY_DN658_c0_g1_i4.p1  ORF type:complete len:361 (-),score=98.91 TRINITY_DN658_c0_g1_i4:1738-2820(-)
MMIEKAGLMQKTKMISTNTDASARLESLMWKVSSQMEMLEDEELKESLSPKETEPSEPSESQLEEEHEYDKDSQLEEPVEYDDRQTESQLEEDGEKQSHLEQQIDAEESQSEETNGQDESTPVLTNHQKAGKDSEELSSKNPVDGSNAKQDVKAARKGKGKQSKVKSKAKEFQSRKEIEISKVCDLVEMVKKNLKDLTGIKEAVMLEVLKMKHFDEIWPLAIDNSGLTRRQISFVKTIVSKWREVLELEREIHALQQEDEQDEKVGANDQPDTRIELDDQQMMWARLSKLARLFKNKDCDLDAIKQQFIDEAEGIDWGFYGWMWDDIVDYSFDEDTREEIHWNVSNWLEERDLEPETFDN